MVRPIGEFNQLDPYVARAGFSPAPEVAGGHTLPCKKRHGLPILKWYGISSCVLWGRSKTGTRNVRVQLIELPYSRCHHRPSFCWWFPPSATVWTELASLEAVGGWLGELEGLLGEVVFIGMVGISKEGTRSLWARFSRGRLERPPPPVIGLKFDMGEGNLRNKKNLIRIFRIFYDFMIF
jgi:hypothetical protein